MASGDSFGLSLKGTSPTTIQVFYKAAGGGWVQLGTNVIDSLGPQTSGYIGFDSGDFFGVSQRFDDFGGGSKNLRAISFQSDSSSGTTFTVTRAKFSTFQSSSTTTTSFAPAANRKSAFTSSSS